MHLDWSDVPDDTFDNSQSGVGGGGIVGGLSKLGKDIGGGVRQADGRARAAKAIAGLGRAQHGLRVSGFAYGSPCSCGDTVPSYLTPGKRVLTPGCPACRA